MSYQEYWFDDNWNIISAASKKRLFGGLKWVGIPFVHSVYKYKFKWISFEQAEEDGQLIEKSISHEDNIDYILLQDDIYYVFVKEVETKGMVPLDIGILLTIRIINPYKALFRVQNWLEATQNQFKPVVISYVGKQEFEQLIQDKEQLGDAVHKILNESKIDQNVEEDYGVHIKKVGFVKIDPTGDLKNQYQEAATKEWEAKKEAKRLDTVYGTITDDKKDRLFIRAIEGLEKASENESTKIVFPLGGIDSLIKSWTGKE
ncbi:MAG: hypothetical protein ISS02_01865 [Candidatus Portnoybacteria bacterium]|nr:hypothetical protein [Candidatus Portnoybacteria bacterium]